MKWVLALFLLAAPAFAEAGWQHYENARFGFSVDIPAGMNQTAEPENGDGATFTSADGSAQLLVWGSHLLDTSLVDEAKFRRSEEEKEGWRISYSPARKGWFAYSGTKAERIVYAKGVSGCGGELALYFRLEYPKAEKKQYDALVEHLSKSLKAGKASDCP